jgi:peptidoglycan/LPS O-acetylase OafA/YrhL
MQEAGSHHGSRLGPTVDDILKLHRGAGPGFDFWRFFLSISIIFLHSFHVAYGTVAGGAQVSFLSPFFAAILPIFFGLSGFLVAGSAIRTASVKVFLGFRALRLMPALAVEVTLSALLLGPLLTTEPLLTYFTSHDFWTYWGNIVGRIRFNLPGMFEDNPVPRIVNLNLWTLHAEILCYAILATAMIIGLLKHRRVALLLWLLVSTLMLALSFALGWFVRVDLYPQSIWIYAFCTGVIAFLWRDRIRLSPFLLAFAVVAYLALYALPALSVLAVVPMMYIMIWVGMQSRLAAKIFKKGDYSYGLYLYGYVIQQTLALAFPSLREWWFIFPAALILTLLFAIISWHLVEKPALKFKRHLSPHAAKPPGTDHPHEQGNADIKRLDAALK